MTKELELVKKIEKVMRERKVPEEIQKAVDEVYIEYLEAYKSLLSKIRQAVENNEKKTMQLNQIAIFMRRDFEEDKEMSTEMIKTSYSIKMENMIENVIKAIQKITIREEKSKRNLPQKEEQEEQEEIEKERRKEEIKINSNATNEDTKLAKQIVASVLMELESSEHSILVKTHDMIADAPNQEFIQCSEAQFKERMKVIKSNAGITLVSKIQEALEKQNTQIMDEILEIYEQYRNKEKELTEREKFMSKWHVDVNPQEAVKRIEEKENEPMLTLSDDVMKE